MNTHFNSPFGVLKFTFDIVNPFIYDSFCLQNCKSSQLYSRINKMSTMSIQDIIDKSPGAPAFDASFAFKLQSESKERFVKFCDERGLSPSNILREMVEQFLAGACPDED